MGCYKSPLAESDWRPQEILAAVGVRYCIVGDLVICALGRHPLVPFDFQLVIADEQLETACQALTTNGYQEFPQTHERFFAESATEESTRGWPGHRFLPNDAGKWATSTIIMPATFWHLDLSRDSWSANTVCIPSTPCRLPRRLVYFRAIIDILANRYLAKGLNYTITSYFEGHYVFLQRSVDDIIAQLPSEDQFFVDLFLKVTPRSVRTKVCHQRQQIRAGIISHDAARNLIPRKDLELDAIKRKYRADAEKA